jgi:hypothetical protein
MNVLFLPRTVLGGLIRAYQATLSPDHGPLKTLYPYGYCRFHPSCSEYGRVAVARHGVVRGSWLLVWRTIRCHPWSEGGVDEVPKT